MNKRIIPLLLILVGCSTPQEPQITPPQPHFIPTSIPPDPVDRGIYADVDPNTNAIWIEWQMDSSRATTGYILRRATDPAIGPDGILADSARIVAQLETTDQTIEPLPTSYRDTAAILPGATFWYQLQAYHRSPTGTLTYSTPTPVDVTTSFHYTNPVIPLSPNGPTKPPPTGQTFSWQDPEDGDSFQIIVERLDSERYVWSERLSEFSNQPIVNYPDSAERLAPNGQYRWRVKRIITHGGSSSRWSSFSILP
ncbi:MAG: hypothetical protein Q8922_06315 [Bacteroidota bacterium]|nr:hypothetical protein [Bacteroidota bacterium]MDP4233772.1 hypothetical protein [Bacteroidota bacterium]MDP4242411.1 hypothetical protein [Bacteroidota bacterium]MDP4287533.1 hypothetical protein [Bacteroidota bacterium]